MTFPPGSLIEETPAVFVTSIDGKKSLSSLVIVQVLLSPAEIVTDPSEAQLPDIDEI